MDSKGVLLTNIPSNKYSIHPPTPTAHYYYTTTPKPATCSKPHHHSHQYLVELQSFRHLSFGERGGVTSGAHVTRVHALVGPQTVHEKAVWLRIGGRNMSAFCKQRDNGLEGRRKDEDLGKTIDDHS